MSKRRKGPREKDLTGRFLSGDYDEDRVDSVERFGARTGRRAEQDKILRTALLRADQDESLADVDSLPVGEVRQVFSLYSEVEHDGKTTLCVIRKTTAKLMETAVVVGDRVRFRELDLPPEERLTTADRPEGVIEQLLPRQTVLTRADSFKAITAHPIVANAEQMLVVVSLRLPVVKWGLVDRMIVAALAGKLRPMICLNKVDLATGPNGANLPDDLVEARTILDHYRSLGVASFEASVTREIGLDDLRLTLAGKTTVLAGHSGVGKSSLVRAIQPHLDLRVGAISGYTNKGRHTTTSARHYPLDFGGAVIDTPGVKLFGLWNVTPENLDDFFPDVAADSAPDWRRKSYERLLASLPEQE